MNNIKIIDTHTHIQFSQFDMDREETIARAISNGIGMISAGTNLSSTKKGIEIAEYYNFIWTTAGIHPHEALKTTEKDIKKLEELSKNNSVVGIGECGLDYSQLKDNKEKQKQKKLLEKQIEISHKTKKPLVIHCRNAFDDILDILKNNKNILYSKNAGICHFFTGTKEIAKEFMDLGFSFTFGGLITKTCEFDDLLKYIPKNHIMIETDAPYVTPQKYIGKRNEPLFIIEVAETLSKLWKINISEVEEITKNNTIKIFNLK